MIDKLHYISQKNSKENHLDAIDKALKSGCKWIQLRIKNEEEASIIEQAKEAKKLCQLFKSKLIINDYPEVAKEVSADGLHLGLADMSVYEARKLVGNNCIIGGTANTFEDILMRKKEGVDYIGLGPFRFTSTKEYLSPVLGLNGYKSILNKMKADGIAIPIIAIGGIELIDVDDLLKAGVYGIAVSGTITNATNTDEVVKSLYNKLEPASLV